MPPKVQPDHNPMRVVVGGLKFGKEATCFESYLEPVESVDIDEDVVDTASASYNKAGSAHNSSGGSPTSTSYGKAGSAPSSSGHSSWNWGSDAVPGTWTAEPGSTEPRDLAYQRHQDAMPDTWTAEPGSLEPRDLAYQRQVMGSQAAALAAAMQYPAWPPYPPAFGMPPFGGMPWWDPTMYHAGMGMMPGNPMLPPGGEKEHLHEMASHFEQMSQQHMHAAKSHGGGRQQKGKGKAALGPAPGYEKEYYENMAQTLSQMAHQHALAAKTCNPQPQQGSQGSRQQQKGKSQPAPKAVPAAPKQEVPVGNQDVEDHPSYTTVMLKNVPSSYTRELLIQTLDEEGFHKLYNFVYLPMEFKKKSLLGYAFVNLIDHETALSFRVAMAGYEKWLADHEGHRLKLDGDKIVPAEVRWGKLHDKQKHIDRYRSSDLMHPSVPKEYKPMVYGEDGKEEPFPGPSGRRTQPPRALKNDQPGARKKEGAAAAAAASSSPS